MSKFLLTLLLLIGSNALAFCPHDAKGTPDEVLLKGESITVNITELDRILAMVAPNNSIKIEKSGINSDINGESKLIGSGEYEITAIDNDVILFHGCPSAG